MLDRVTEREREEGGSIRGCVRELDSLQVIPAEIEFKELTTCTYYLHAYAPSAEP